MTVLRQERIIPSPLLSDNVPACKRANLRCVIDSLAPLCYTPGCIQLYKHKLGEQRERASRLSWIGVAEGAIGPGGRSDNLSGRWIALGQHSGEFLRRRQDTDGASRTVVWT